MLSSSVLTAQSDVEPYRALFGELEQLSAFDDDARTDRGPGRRSVPAAVMSVLTLGSRLSASRPSWTVESVFGGR